MNLSVVELGDVGLPLALQFARSGASIVVLDIDEPKVDQINCGRSLHQAHG
jgi:UDP-N-acetyl-D-glucosamine dehydrogenase